MTLTAYLNEVADLKKEERAIRTQSSDRPLTRDEAEDRLVAIRNRRHEMAIEYWSNR